MQSSAYLNGNWITSDKLHVAVDDIGFLLGATVTEGLRTFGGRLFRLDEHMARLNRSLEIVGLDASAITDEIRRAAEEFVVRNRGAVAADDDWSVSAFATPGVSGGGRPTVCVHGHPLHFHLWADQYDEGVPVVVSSIRQIPPASLPPELKCRSRMHFYLADREAAATRPGARAILLDEDGLVAEATSANVLIYREGEGLVSPPHGHILFGVSVGVVHELAEKLAIPFVTRPIAAHELQGAVEAMLTSTSICLVPIVECDGQPIADGKPGPVYGRLLEAWSEMVGVDVAAQARRFATRPA